MKQIIVRMLCPGIPVYDFAYGEIVDNQFRPLDVKDLPGEVLECVTVSDLLGTQAYIHVSSLLRLVKLLVPCASEFRYYDHFLVFEMNPGYGTQEENEE